MEVRYPPYTPIEMKEFLNDWSNKIAVEQPELAEEIVRNIVKGENDGEEGS